MIHGQNEYPRIKIKFTFEDIELYANKFASTNETMTEQRFNHDTTQRDDHK